MGQAFFTLSVGVGCMTIFGSYIGKYHSLVKESAIIIAIDTFVAFMSGLIIFPACATFDIAVNSGPGLIFEVLPKVFAAMPGGKIWATLFFLFLSLAALTTIVAVFECIIGGILDQTKRKRAQISLTVGIVVAIGTLPTIMFSKTLEIEDFIFSQLWLPLGAMVTSIFVSRRFGWGFENFRAEASSGNGAELPRMFEPVMKWIIPTLIAIVMICGIIG
jgi:NSS family neurotransmitter:Na+ symporter